MLTAQYISTAMFHNVQQDYHNNTNTIMNSEIRGGEIMVNSADQPSLTQAFIKSQIKRQLAARAMICRP